MENPNWEERLALDFLDKCMDLNPGRRFSASESLKHSFLNGATDDELIDDTVLILKA